MIIQINGTMDAYLDTADAITAALREESGPILTLLHDFHDYFATTLWRDADGVAPIAAMLSMNSFMTYLAGVRVAMSGHVVAVFPVLRTSLESACYAYLINKNRKLESVWTDRHKGDAERKACRVAFTGAVAEVAKSVERAQPGGGYWLREAYDTAIDFGGHPNFKSVFGHISVEEDRVEDPFYRVNLAGLYGADHWETRRILIACADFALAIAVVLTRALDKPDQRHQAELQILSDRKNAVSDDLMTGRLS